MEKREIFEYSMKRQAMEAKISLKGKINFEKDEELLLQGAVGFVNIFYTIPTLKKASLFIPTNAGFDQKLIGLGFLREDEKMVLSK